jgi:hypothetical protein
MAGAKVSAANECDREIVITSREQRSGKPVIRSVFLLLPTEPCDRRAKDRFNLGYNSKRVTTLKACTNTSDDACAIPSLSSAVGTGRSRIIADLYHDATASSSITFRKTQHRVPVRDARKVRNFLVFSGKSVHKWRLLELFLKRGELLLQLDDFVAQVCDFPFEVYQTLGVSCGDTRFVSGG